MSSTSASRSVLVLRACDRHEGVAGAPGQIPPADSRRGGCFCDGPVVGEDAILARLSPGTTKPSVQPTLEEVWEDKLHLGVI